MFDSMTLLKNLTEKNSDNNRVNILVSVFKKKNKKKKTEFI